MNLDTGILIATRGEVQVVGATSYLGGASGLVQLSGSALEVSDGARFEPGLLLAYASGDAFSQITFAGGAQIRTGAEGADFDLTGIFGSDVLVDGESTVEARLAHAPSPWSDGQRVRGDLGLVPIWHFAAQAPTSWDNRGKMGR